MHGFAQKLGLETLGSTNPKVGHYVERITAAVEHMGRLVDGLLALSHVTRRKLQYEDVDISKTAADVFEMLRRLDPQRDALLRVEPGLVARADGRLIASLLENLLGNAWKFSSGKAHAVISVGAASRSPGEMVFFVRDNGAGFDMEQAGQLFNAFERLHEASEFPGTGIGLATVNRVAARHGGRVWAESSPGQGACFYVALPQA
jgi:signal transduction histidine kinase